MFVYSLSRKQCGVIFCNIKNGKITVSDKFINWMYKFECDTKVFHDSSKDIDVFTKMKNGLDAIFAGDFEKANKDLNDAFIVWHAFFMEA